MFVLKTSTTVGTDCGRVTVFFKGATKECKQGRSVVLMSKVNVVKVQSECAEIVLVKFRQCSESKEARRC